jgi:5'-methylthioadenosine phosphorylase
MTNVQEAKLAREAEICYSTMALVTDYDCWHVEEEEVTLEVVLKNLEKNVETAKRIIKAALPMLKPERQCPCPTAISKAIVTNRDLIPEETKKRLDIIIGKYLSK